MRLKSIRSRIMLWCLALGLVFFCLSLGIYSLIESHDRFAAFVTALFVFGVLAALFSYILTAYELWPFKRFAEVGRMAGRGDASWEELPLVEGAGLEEVRTVIDVFNTIKERMDDAVLSQKRFLADASHEMRSPLTIMKGDIEIALRRERENEEYKRVLESNLEEIDRLEFLVKDLMFLARTDASELVLNVSPVELCAVLDEVCSKLIPMAMQKNISLDFDTSCPEIAVVDADPDRLIQLFVNIIENALRYTPGGGRVKVDLKRIADVYKVVVTDTGMGIPEAELERIFDRFYRVDKARARASGGTGLGLCICKWIVDAHKGEISIKSKEGIGTEVTVMLLPSLP
jgi:signal transduction histidine kinase